MASELYFWKKLLGKLLSLSLVHTLKWGEGYLLNRTIEELNEAIANC